MTKRELDAAYSELHDLRKVLDSLRTHMDGLLHSVVALDARVAKLEAERYSRETELTDLRTRFETLIKRISGRVDRHGVKDEETDLPLHLRVTRGRKP